MQRFKQILYVAQGTAAEQAALGRAVALAERNGARLTVTRVVTPPPRLPAYGSGITPSKLHGLIAKEAEVDLERLTRALATRTVQIETKLLVGTPFVEIVREVVYGKHDLVIKGAEEEKSPSALLFGSTDLHLLRKCPCPVWILKSIRAERCRRVLAAVDPCTEDEDDQGLDRLILDLATSIAQSDGSELDVIHTWTLYAERALRSRNLLPVREFKRMEGETRNLHEKRLHALLTDYRFDPNKLRIHLLKGEAGEIVPRLAREREIDLIVMGTVARTGIPGFFIGNTAERILSRVDCSVLAVKPKGFVTPVKFER